MRKQAFLLAVLALTLVSCAGVYGPKGNDTGGIIPWSPENEQNALTIAQDNCGRYNRYAVISTIHREYGDYISYLCRWYPPPASRLYRS